MESKSTLGKKKTPDKASRLFHYIFFYINLFGNRQTGSENEGELKPWPVSSFSLKYFGAKTAVGTSCVFRGKFPTERLTVSRLFQQTLFAWIFFDQRKLDIQIFSFPLLFSQKKIVPNLSTYEQTYIKDFMTCLTVRSWIVSPRDFLLKIQQRTDLLQSVWQDLNATLSNNRHHTRKS